ncbi:hypothetical protein U732_58 [Clostridium argentinense CDC 2741]|uniref:Uncharacterized protein n=2 Tax=Clostridium argentinense TaxID=29341 RepID=A0A0C1UBK1_9CLOT|nr:hypothetical protein [Clostridium argentinense]ARC83087.1 hypothetical protein RSJ17_00090 [Clostridium argentinense]KIE44930.1 hypothetical protein U732_58 [Clostridium argentinense CDC 2741]NFF41836.1 hypothetical protein [Clostridium argentinense]NFP51744.1 hypothetical protein [Clostridium argentinense]NFP74893.1 hypothetical protein [Clostridium argentinense]
MEYKENIYAHLKKLQDEKYSSKKEENILSLINSLEKARINLYSVVQDFLSSNELLMSMAPEFEYKFNLTEHDILMERIKEWSVKEYPDKIVLETDHIPMNLYSKSIMSEFVEEQQFIKFATYKLLAPLSKKYSFEKLFILFDVISPITQYDVDNRYFKPYLDGIVKAQLLKCDSINFLSYAFRGTFSEEKFGVKITIKDYYLIEKYLD